MPRSRSALLLAVLAVTSLTVRVLHHDAVAVLSTSTTITDNTFTTASSFGTCATRTAIFVTGFERGPTTASWGTFNTGSTAGGSIATETTPRRNGGYALKVAKTSTGTVYGERTVGTGKTHVVARFGVYLDSLPTATVSELASFTAAAGSPVKLGYNAVSQTLELAFGANPPTPSSTTITAGSWTLVEVKVDFSVNPRAADWRINGSAQLPISSAEATSTAAAWRAGSVVSGDLFTARYDDVVLSTTAADYPIGDGATRLLLPSGMGTSVGSANFQNDDSTAINATSYERLDEIPMTSTTDFVKQVTASSTSYLEVQMGDSVTGSCFNGVQAVTTTHASGTGANVGKSSVFSGTTESIVFSGDMGGTALDYRWAVVTPSSTPWTKSQIDALVFRIGYSSDVAPVPYWDAVVLEYDIAA